jgi:hypothetical protein
MFIYGMLNIIYIMGWLNKLSKYHLLTSYYVYYVVVINDYKLINWVIIIN